MIRHTAIRILLPVLLIGGGVAAVMLLLVLKLSSPDEKAAALGVRIGVDKCHECGMIISDIRYAVVAQYTDAIAGDTIQRFDDIGCFFSVVAKQPSSHWDGVVFHHETGTKIPLGIARFEQGDYHTPMGSGWIAHSDNSSGTTFADATRSLAE